MLHTEIFNEDIDHVFDVGPKNIVCTEEFYNTLRFHYDLVETDIASESINEGISDGAKYCYYMKNMKDGNSNLDLKFKVFKICLTSNNFFIFSKSPIDYFEINVVTLSIKEQYKNTDSIEIDNDIKDFIKYIFTENDKRDDVKSNEVIVLEYFKSDDRDSIAKYLISNKPPIDLILHMISTNCYRYVKDITQFLDELSELSYMRRTVKLSAFYRYLVCGLSDSNKKRRKKIE